MEAYVFYSIGLDLPRIGNGDRKGSHSIATRSFSASEDFMTVGWVGLKMTCSGEQIASLIHQLVSTFSVYLTLIESTPIFMICFVGMTMLQL